MKKLDVSVAGHSGIIPNFLHPDLIPGLRELLNKFDKILDS